MIWGIGYDVWMAILYPIIGAIGLGVWWELLDEDERTADNFMEGLIPATFWGLGVIVGAAIATGWLLMWIPRGPTKLIKWLMNRKSIPEARIV